MMTSMFCPSCGETLKIHTEGSTIIQSCRCGYVKAHFKDNRYDLGIKPLTLDMLIISDEKK